MEENHSSFGSEDFQEALKKIELVHLLEVEEGTMLYDTELKE